MFETKNIPLLTHFLIELTLSLLSTTQRQYILLHDLQLKIKHQN